MTQTIGSFTGIKNEVQWVGFNIMSWLPHLAEMIFFDGDSTDGTVELIEYIQKHIEGGERIKLFKGQDPKDLKDDYVRVWDECLKQVKSDYALYIHPDMILTGWPRGLKLGGLAYTTKIRSFAGEPLGELFEFSEGRTDRWKNLMSNSLGLHYDGHYGAAYEDMYFRDITGDDHTLYPNMNSYPYEVKESGIELNHYSDVRPYSRRLGRMVSCLMNQHPGCHVAVAGS